MTEAEWLACNEPSLLLHYLRDKRVERKLRLFSCACCREAWNVLEEEGRHAIEVAERYADGAASDTERRKARLVAQTARTSGLKDRSLRAAIRATYEALNRDAMVAATDSRSYLAPDSDDAVQRVLHTAFLRDIFGNPFRPISLDPSWLTSDVVALAKGIYAERAFDRMPILADALQDAGCDDEDVLSHCRNTSLTHARGCWVVDLVLGKE